MNSCGYHADDGNLYHERGVGITFGPTCTDGDRMGCGVDFSTDYGSGYVNVFFTKNGKQVRKEGRVSKYQEGQERWGEVEGGETKTKWEREGWGVERQM